MSAADGLNLLFFATEFALVSALLLGAFSLRSRLGLGPVVAVVASIQLLQALLGASLFWRIGDGVSVNPGSSILFAGNLALVVFAYARDGGLSARVILYGVIIANFVNVAMNLVFSLHIQTVTPTWLGAEASELFATGLAPAVVGVALLYVDQVLALLMFAALKKRFPSLPVWVVLPIVLSTVLMFDTVGYLGLLLFGRPDFSDLLWSGVVSKGLGGLTFGVVWGLVLARQSNDQEHSVNDLLGLLLFRENLTTLRRAAVSDEMTGLFNRRSYRLVTERLVEESSADAPFCLVLIDADHFKQVNDRLGHSKGDEVIISIARHIKSCTRDQDFAFRFGGDEFAVVLPKCDRVGARDAAVRIGAFSFDDDELEDPVTLTLGLAEYPKDARTLEGLFDVADKRLYEGKQLGRKQIISQSMEL